jgi:hypothetical protein
MEKYIVEFQSIYADSIEVSEINFALEKASDLCIDPNFYHTKDYMGVSAIDLTRVVGYDEGTVYFNDQVLSCVYAEFVNKDGASYYSRNLLYKLEDFKTLIEYVNKLKVKTPSQVMHEIQIEKVEKLEK